MYFKHCLLVAAFHGIKSICARSKKGKFISPTTPIGTIKLFLLRSFTSFSLSCCKRSSSSSRRRHLHRIVDILLVPEEFAREAFACQQTLLHHRSASRDYLAE